MLHRDAIPLLFAFVASLVIHFAAIPFFTNKQFRSPFAPPSDASHLETRILEEPEIELGIEQSEASTLTWIGYEQYEKHLAKLAQVEQAAMQLKRSSTSSQQKNTTQTLVKDASTAVAPLTDAASKLAKALGDLQISVASPPPPETVQPTKGRTGEEEIELVAEPADLEADPTSIVEVPKENWKTGRPIAAEGIILRPRRPSFTAHQSVTNAPRGLTAVLDIDHRGRPIGVEVVRGTGSSSIDRSLVASLYRWRAAGEKIDAIVEGESFEITIHISFAR